MTRFSFQEGLIVDRQKMWRVLKGDTTGLSREEAGMMLVAISNGIRMFGMFLFLVGVIGYYVVGAQRAVMFALVFGGGLFACMGHSFLKTVRR